MALDLHLGGDGDLALELVGGPPVVVVKEGEPRRIVPRAPDARPSRSLVRHRSDHRDAGVADLPTEARQPPVPGIIDKQYFDNSLVRLRAHGLQCPVQAGVTQSGARDDHRRDFHAFPPYLGSDCRTRTARRTSRSRGTRKSRIHTSTCAVSGRHRGRPRPRSSVAPSRRARATSSLCSSCRTWPGRIWECLLANR